MKSFLNLVTLSLAALKLVFQAAWALLKEQGRGGKRGGLPNRSYYLPGLCKPFGICFETYLGAADASRVAAPAPGLAQPSSGVKAAPWGNPDPPHGSGEG